MIAIEDLKRIGRLKGLGNVGNIEKDYILDMALLSVSRNTKDELVFKGGTCLYKFYKLERFSEDLDFALGNELNTDALIRKIISDLGSFGIEAESREKRHAYNSIMATIRTKGPLYRGTPQSASNIGIDINLKSGVEMKPELATYMSLYPDIPPFSLLIMKEPEILAEKARAILTRAKARDVYDLWFLLKKGIDFDENLVRKKMEYYGQEWDSREFRRRLGMQKAAWKTELSRLVLRVPDFGEVKKVILQKIPAA